MEHLTAKSEADPRNTSTEPKTNSNQSSQEFNHSYIKSTEQYHPLDVSAAESPPYPRQFRPVMDSVHCEKKLVGTHSKVDVDDAQGPSSFTTAAQCFEK